MKISAIAYQIIFLLIFASCKNNENGSTSSSESSEQSIEPTSYRDKEYVQITPEGSEQDENFISQAEIINDFSQFNNIKNLLDPNNSNIVPAPVEHLGKSFYLVKCYDNKPVMSEIEEEFGEVDAEIGRYDMVCKIDSVNYSTKGFWAESAYGFNKKDNSVYTHTITGFDAKILNYTHLRYVEQNTSRIKFNSYEKLAVVKLGSSFAEIVPLARRRK